MKTEHKKKNTVRILMKVIWNMIRAEAADAKMM